MPLMRVRGDAYVLKRTVVRLAGIEPATSCSAGMRWEAHVSGTLA